MWCTRPTWRPAWPRWRTASPSWPTPPAPPARTPRPPGTWRPARDRDIADLAVKVDANRSAINALGEQTREWFDSLENKVDNGFTEMRGKLDATAAGQQQIVSLLNTIIGQQGEPDPDDQ